MSEPRDRPVPLLERFERFLDAVIPPPDEIAAIVRRGEALLVAGDPTGALRMAEQALGAAPGYLRGLLLKADSLAARGAPYDALAALDEASRDRALPPEALARMVEYAAAVGDERRALDLEAHTRARVRGTDRDVARRLLLGARSLVARGMDASGLRLARSATLVDPSLGAAWLLLADDALRRGDRPQSRRALERALPLLESTDAWANRLAGDLALAHEELAAAARHLRRAWIAGDDSAVAPLVFVLARRGDRAALERVVADAQGSVAGMARAVYELGEGEREARSVLEPVKGPDLPDALWTLALETTLRAAPDIAERWAREAPERAGSAAVTALTTARARLAAGDAVGARAVLDPALADVGTAAAARELFRDACRTAWRARLDAMLEELAVLARNSRVLAPLETELRTRRRELDDPLRVGILGEFSAGKSTFLNALVGATVSPMGVLP
ncbi:MAG: dynamin family protein, partial [Deltaproteobacteria bacterium]